MRGTVGSDDASRLANQFAGGVPENPRHRSVDPRTSTRAHARDTDEVVFEEHVLIVQMLCDRCAPSRVP